MLRILVIIYIDSRSLYNYLVKLSIINKKRLIINIMFLKEVYKNKRSLKSNKLIKKIIP
jgi:hypothetical protein